jgi:hypothetical protein
LRKVSFYPCDVEEWATWYETSLPHDDDAVKYKAEHPDEWHIPLGDILFRGPPKLTHERSAEAVSTPAPAIPFTDTVNLASYTGKRGPGKKIKRKLRNDEVGSDSIDVDMEEEDSGDDFEYFDVDPDLEDAVLKRGRNTIDLFSYIGKEFDDIADTDPSHNPYSHGKVVAVSTCDKFEGCYFFKYYNPTATLSADLNELPVDENAYAYTACQEMLPPYNKSNPEVYRWVVTE